MATPKIPEPGSPKGSQKRSLDDERTDSEIRRPAEPAPRRGRESWSLGSVLDGFLQDPTVNEIMVNDTRSVMLEREGKLVFSGYAFTTQAELGNMVDLVLEIIGKPLDPADPCVDGSLPDGTRVNIVAPPAAPGGPSLTFRKFPSQSYSAEQLVQAGMLDEKLARLFRACVIGRLNIVLSGGTSSGKTTLLNALLRWVPSGERIITVEDTLELVSDHPNSVRLRSSESTPSRRLVSNALRMRPDRIIIGECRGGEAFDMLQAMNTGHSGSMTTLHANSPRDALSRLETLCLLSHVELPLPAVRRQIAASIDLLIHLGRGASGRRRVSQVSEVTGMEGETVTLQDLFVTDGGSSEILRPTGFTPTFARRLKEAGIDLG